MKINASDRYLIIPVSYNTETKKLTISEVTDGEKKVIWRYDVPVMREDHGKDPRDFLGVFPLKDHAGKELLIEGEEALVSKITVSETRPEKKEKGPKIHFAPAYGWINDPNGLTFDGEKYHMYFQFNPMGKDWGNMTWGHAVSGDLLHWQEEDPVLFPGEEGTMFSGSGVLKDGKRIFFYTGAGRFGLDTEIPFCQYMAESEDGYTMVKKGKVVPFIAGENRDPKVYEDPEGGYYMVLYLDKEDFGVFHSENLQNWEMTQRIELKGLFECPDLRMIYTKDRSFGRYMFSAADGYYYLGSFDGKVFTPETKMQESYETALPYAAQTFYGEERVIQIPWLRTIRKDEARTGDMGIPRELILSDDHEHVLLALPEEVMKQKAVKIGAEGKITLKKDTAFLLSHEGTLGSFAMSLREGLKIVYDEEEKTLAISGITGTLDPEVIGKKPEKEALTGKENARCFHLQERPAELSVLVDEKLLEITADNGRKIYQYELEKKACLEDEELTVTYPKGMQMVIREF